MERIEPDTPEHKQRAERLYKQWCDQIEANMDRRDISCGTYQAMWERAVIESRMDSHEASRHE